MKNPELYNKKQQGLWKKTLTLMVIISIFFWSGCTVIGLVLGSSAERKSKKPIQISGWDIQQIDPGTEFTFVMKNGEQKTGKFKQLILLNDTEYEQLYSESTKELKEKLNLPKIGDVVNITISDLTHPEQKTVVSQVFSGFDQNYLLLKSENQKEMWYSFKNIDLASLSDGTLLNLINIQILLKTGNIPVKTFILIDNNEKINPGEIQYVQYKSKSKNETLWYAAAGATLDILFFGIIGSNIKVFSSSSSSSSDGLKFGSCPFVYSYDGTEYRLDSETFGGAIFKAAQRTDLDNLDYLNEQNGYYKLRLTNELDETQYVDELKLLVVDHPEGTKVVPSFDGSFHVLSNVTTPVSARDMEMNDVLHLIEADDDHIWVSNPFNRNPQITSDGRDFMTVRFNKPVKSEKVRLVFNVQNTPWAATLQKDLMALHGNQLQNWYKLMNSSENAREAFKKAMIREGMLQVKVWNGTSWIYKDFVWEVGPFIPKRQVVALDIHDIPGESLDIRLESTVGFWMINSVGADFTSSVTPDFHELSAYSAIDHTGKNVLESLKSNDGTYHIMPTTKDKVDITFKSVPVKKEHTRTYLLKCSGYYHIHTDETGEPNYALLNKLTSEPGAYGQFVLTQLHKDLISVGFK